MEYVSSDRKLLPYGMMNFEDIRLDNYYYVDKTNLIKELLESRIAEVTLITRPRRFGKTLTMSMTEQFFSMEYAGRSDLFEELEIWNDEKYRNLQGTYPVISLSFANIKEPTYELTQKKICDLIAQLYFKFDFITESNALIKEEVNLYKKIMNHMDYVDATLSLNYLSGFLYKYYGKKVIILLDEYDTPMQESYIYGYWEELTSFMRNLFNATFKTNSSLERALMTGITRVSKESMFSDLNNLNVVSTTSDQYTEAFGFTEQEVFGALEKYQLSDKKEDVKLWYDGFTFGSHKDIYNPWSITNYLDKKELKPYWASTSSNGLVDKLLQTGSAEMKTRMETLLDGGNITVNIDEQIVFDQLEQNEDAVWSLLLAGGYLKVENLKYEGITREPWYTLSITNLETISMFTNMFKGWFGRSLSNYNAFVKALIQGDVDAMNYYMQRVCMATFSYFDVGSGQGADCEPERFYHGFVLGLMADQADIYETRSNRESGFGRYDVMLIPRDRKRQGLPAVIMEFKVHNSRQEADLEATVQAALSQIEEKNYDAELLGRGFEKEQIRHYGFAFKGKEVLIG